MRNLVRAFVVCCFLAGMFSGLAYGQNKPLLTRTPTANATHIAFNFAGDLWSVPREGGEAVRLTTGMGNESSPYFSPDGKTIAFTGQYDGNTDVYVVPAEGGVPKRLTWHPGDDEAVGWTPDGKRVLYVSGQASASRRYNRLFTIGLDGGLPEEVPLPMGYDGAFSPDGTHLAYTPIPRAFDAWKRYRGGMTSAIWIADLKDSSVVPVPRDNSNDFNPMWIGEKVYFLSDRAGAITIYSYDPRTRLVAAVVKNTGLDIKSATAAATGDAIVYEQFGSLKLLDLKSGTSKPVPVTISGDLPGVRPRFEKVAGGILSSGISPTGARAVFEARGEILTVPAEKGDVRNVTGTTGAAERSPSWSPDGKWIAYFSDESGEYALHLHDQKTNEVKKIALEPSFYYGPVWSPDGKKISFTDKRLNLWYVDVEKGKPVKIDTSRRGEDFNQSWSPDSRWIAYAKPLPSWYSAVFLYSLDDAKSTQLTDGLSDAGNPVFDKNGKHLYLTASTNIGPAVFGFDMSSYPHRGRVTRNVYIVVLKKGDPSPLAPESDEEKVADEKKADRPAENGKKEPPRVTVDFDGISQRILALPVPDRNFIGLTAGKADTLFLVEGPSAPDAAGAVVHKFDLTKRKLDKVLENVQAFDVSANGEKMLYRQGPGWFIVSTMQPVKPGEGRIRTDDLEVFVEPKAEWKQMYRETWRIERDFFYDPNYHGLDLKATEKKYEPYLETLGHRSDLNYLFQEMLGELTIGHLYVRGGDMPDPKRVPGGLLGADYKIENGRYRFAKVYNGENWNPALRAPLTPPGVDVKAGEYLLAVNGRDLTATDNVHAALEATANKQVVLRVGPTPDGANSREVTVVPVESETALRNLDWIESNRRKVDALTGGKVAYVWLPDTAQGGYTNFNRYYFSQLDKDAAVIDERFNSGGQAADYVIDYLRKPLMSYWTVRDGDDFRQPFGTMPGPKVMLINEYAGSGGDYMPWMFRRAAIGPLIGKRTWGGLVGIGGYPVLLDSGTVTAPHFAFYSPDGKWEIENHGVAPDIEVEMDPKAWREGRDPQLEKAVEIVMAALKKNPPRKPVKPAYPNYHLKK